MVPQMEMLSRFQSIARNCRNQALAQACAVSSPFVGSMSVIDSMTMSAPRSK
jgi:hypothetical protein